MRWVVFILGLCACDFDPSTLNDTNEDAAPDDVNRPDARSFPDAAPPADAVSMCTPNAKQCIDGVLETCLADGTGLDPAQAEVCDFACVDNDHCVSASNLSGSDIAQCNGQYLPFAPAAGASLVFADSGGTPELQCAPDCGDGSTTAIAAQPLITQGGGPPLAMFCLSVLDLPEGAQLSANANLPWAIALVVDGSASVAGTIDLSGGDGTSGAAGTAGPGGGAGGPLHNGQTAPGEGACPGLGGQRGGTSGDRIGGGGGGGGFAASGGTGGRAQSGGGDTAAGGAGGGNCGSDILVPLVAGSGGGSGGDGTGGVIGWPGGGGGGSIQISAKLSLTHTGSILAEGGGGFSVVAVSLKNGGGSGGGVVLESPTLDVTGGFSVDGGNGAEGSAGSGGDGASGSSLSGEGGTDEDGSDESGGGGGGGGGRVRLNASQTPVCNKVSPADACTVGTLATP
jgi:hypothetical protein